MKILVAGFGSIGRRHAELLAAYADIGVLELSGSRRTEASQTDAKEVFSTPAAAKAWKPDAIVLATPTHLHADSCLDFIDVGCPILIEKPASNSRTHLQAFADLPKAIRSRIKVMANMRCHPGPATISSHLELVGTVRSAHAHFGSYLPTMRPNIDYRTVYAAKRAEGGGVLLDCIHELDYLWWLFGPPTLRQGHIARLSELEMDVEDHSVTILDHANGARSVIELDYLQQHKFRSCRVTGDHGTLWWQSRYKAPEIVEIAFYEASRREPTLLVSDPVYDNNHAYRSYLTAFVEFVESGQASFLLDLDTATQQVSLLLDILESQEPYVPALQHAG